MTRGSRIALLVVALVILVGGIVFATSSGEDEPETDGATQAAETRPAPDEATGRGGTATQQAPPPPRVESVRIRDGRPVGNARTLKFERGDTIRLRFSSNAASEVHIHGFDKYVNVPAGGTARARFKANLEGVFEVEDHGTAALLAKLEIRP
jgi:hypothetical protein